MTNFKTDPLTVQSEFRNLVMSAMEQALDAGIPSERIVGIMQELATAQHSPVELGFEGQDAWEGHVYCSVCGDCVTCNLRLCRDGGAHVPRKPDPGTMTPAEIDLRHRAGVL